MRSTVREYVAFIRNNGRWLTAGFLLTFLSSFGLTLSIGLSGHDIRAAHGLSGREFGSLYMVATLCIALTLPWLGRERKGVEPGQCVSVSEDQGGSRPL